MATQTGQYLGEKLDPSLGKPPEGGEGKKRKKGMKTRNNRDMEETEVASE